MKVLEFGAVWCKECLVMKPMWGEIEADMPELKTQYFEADECPEELEKYGVKDIPTFIFLDNENNELLRLQGMQSKEELIEKIKENLDK